MPALTNQLRLEQMSKEKPLVTGDEKIAVFGAGGQIGTKLRPLLDKLYPGQVIYCEDPQFADAKKMHPLDVCNGQDVRDFIKQHNVKAIINLAALLSAAAEKDPMKALEVNYYAPINLMRIAKDCGVRKLQIMSSIAAQEFEPELYADREVRDAVTMLHEKGVISPYVVPQGVYGMQKMMLERTADMFVKHYGLDVSTPRLAGVLNCHTPWPSDGTTEELDKMIVACAEHAVYGDKAPHLKDGKYIPAVPATAAFTMVDGRTLAESVLMLMHQDMRQPLRGQKTAAGAVHNISEYSIRMYEASQILKKLNPEFPIEFAPLEPGSPLYVNLNKGKMKRADIWPKDQDTASAEALIGDFKQYDAEQSIREQYERVVKIFKEQKLRESGVGVTLPASGAHRVAG